jgi:hypothetical protein
MYIKLNNGLIEKYPYTIGELRKDNPQVSFPSQVPNETLMEYGVFPVEPVGTPTVGLDKNVSEGEPQNFGGTWTQVWVITDAPYEEHLSRVLAARANEYPPMTDYLDGVVKGDQEQIQAYIDACLAVKAKYPKPNQGGV